ncbi:hypothetical protein BRARA_A02253, partial [Brassica rapa]
MFEEEWLEFAMSETPLTCPHKRNNVGGSFAVPGSETIPNLQRGIVIREPIIRLASPPREPVNKGKGKVIATEGDTNAPTLNCHLPELSINRRPYGGNGESSRAVRRRLFDGPTVPTNRAVEVEEHAEAEGETIEPQTVGRQSRVVQPSSLYTWTRFQDSLHDLLNDESSEPVLFARDAPPVIDSLEEDGDNLFVGQVFKSKTDCKIKIAIQAINRKFHFKIKRSIPNFMVLICIAIDCPWRVYAAKLDGTGNFQIRQATLRHSCSVDARCNYHKLATTQVIGEIIQSRFIGIKRGPTPATIRKLMLDDFNVNVSYWKSWRSREIAMESVLGSMAGSYALMPVYMGLLQTTNPGSICALKTTENSDGGTLFKYAFIAFGASIKRYRYMRKVIIIDGTSLKGRYGGCLMSACVQDGNFQNFPLAFAVVDSENDASWEWFLTQLKEFFFDSGHLVFVSDRHGSIYNAIGTVFPAATHAACTVHLWRNIKARAYTVEGFNKIFLAIQRVSPGCAAYLVDIGFEHWTRAHFSGDRYNIMLCTTLMSWFALRCAKALEHKGTLTPKVPGQVELNFESSTSLAVCGISETEFQVMAQSGECAYEVKIYPIPSVGENEIGGEYAGDLLPPEVRRPPGRPQKVRILSWSEEK